MDPRPFTFDLIREFYRLDGEDVIWIKTGRVCVPRPNGYSNLGPRSWPRSIGYHRVKFFLAHGYMPPRVDHRDGSRGNGLLANLRPATQSTNMMNQPNVHARRSLPRGVYLRPSGRYQGKAWDGKRYHVLGMFDTASGASAAVEEMLRRLHGEFYVKPKEP